MEDFQGEKLVPMRGLEIGLSTLRSLQRILCFASAGISANFIALNQTNEIMKFLKVIASITAVLGVALFSSCGSSGPAMAEPPSYVAPAK